MIVPVQKPDGSVTLPPGIAPHQVSQNPESIFLHLNPLDQAANDVWQHGSTKRVSARDGGEAESEIAAEDAS